MINDFHKRNSQRLEKCWSEGLSIPMKA